MIRHANLDDAERITEIYNHYVLHTIETFENNAHSPVTLKERMQRIERFGLPWLVAEDSGEVIGYAYASKWRDRENNKKSAEVSVFIHPDFNDKDWDSQLMQALIDEVKARGIQLAIGGIALPNPQSIALHEKFGMEKVAHFEQVGLKFDRWVDVAYWQLSIDSAVA